MTRFFIVTAAATLFLAGCLNAPDQPQPMYARDHVYCWRLKSDGNWVIKGSADMCPPGARNKER